MKRIEKSMAWEPEVNDIKLFSDSQQKYQIDKKLIGQWYKNPSKTWLAIIQVQIMQMM